MKGYSIGLTGCRKRYFYRLRKKAGTKAPGFSTLLILTLVIDRNNINVYNFSNY
jgi:hypothetical protein